MKSFSLQPEVGQLAKEYVNALDIESAGVSFSIHSGKKIESKPSYSKRHIVYPAGGHIRYSSRIAAASIVIVAMVFGLIVSPWKHHFLYAAVLYLWGLFGWTFIEYLWHRFVIHGATHNRPERHFMQQSTGHFPCGGHRVLVIILVTAALFASIWQSICFLLCCGFFSGCLASCYMRIFMQWKGMAKLMPALHRQHLYHLAGGIDRGYGWTTTFWDYLFGTHVPLGYVHSDKKAE